MTVDVILYAGEASIRPLKGKVAAVIDVFRATSVIVEALHNGAERVVPAVSVEEVWQLAKGYERNKILLGGERDTVKIEGFDKDNSPRAYNREDVAGKTIIFTTTNGTRAIRNASTAGELYIASFLNMSAVCGVLAKSGNDIVLVCSGRSDNFTTEDGLCAGAVVSELTQIYGYEMTDIAELMRLMYEAAKCDLRERLSTTAHYSDIMRRGYDADIEFCLQRDIYSIVPVYDKQGYITVK